MWSGQEDLARGGGAEAAAGDDQDRRPRREAADARHRRSVEEGEPRRTALSPPLRRGLVVQRAVDRLPDEGVARSLQAARLGEIPPHGNLHGPGDGARAEEVLLPLALCRGVDDRRGGGPAYLP